MRRVWSGFVGFRTRTKEHSNKPYGYLKFFSEGTTLPVKFQAPAAK